MEEIFRLLTQQYENEHEEHQDLASFMLFGKNCKYSQFLFGKFSVSITTTNEVKSETWFH